MWSTNDKSEFIRASCGLSDFQPRRERCRASPQCGRRPAIQTCPVQDQNATSAFRMGIDTQSTPQAVVYSRLGNILLQRDWGTGKFQRALIPTALMAHL